MNKIGREESMILNEDNYRKKVRAGWLGKCIGGNMGAIPECLKKRSFFTGPEEYMPEKMLANDDLDLQLVWIQVLLDKGFHFTSDDLMEEFIKCYPADPNEYGYGKRNYRRGIKPPVSGIFANDFFMNSMGCPIRAEIWAMIYPGNPKRGIELAYRDGCLDHGTESIYAEQYITALESLAFVNRDRQFVIHKALEFIPETSRIFGIITEITNAYDKGISLEEVMLFLEKEYGNVDCSISFYNMGVIILALLYGSGNFEKTITLAINCGYDTDCTAATLGAVMGILYGEGIFGDKWLNYCGEEIITGCINLHYDILTINKLSEITCSLAREAALQKQPEESGGTLIVEYMGKPEISPVEPAAVCVKVCGFQEGAIDSIQWEAQDDLTVQLDHLRKTDTDMEYYYLINMPEDAGCLKEHYILTVFLKDLDGRTIGRQDIGLAGKQPFRIMGPYWDMYDWKRVSEEERISKELYFPFPGHKIYRYLSLAEAHNNFVFPEREYIAEDFGREKFQEYFDAGKSYFSSEDYLIADEVFGYRGPCCMYALQKLYLEKEEEVQFHIGSTTPFRLWVNGDVRYDMREFKGYCPYNDLVKCKLRKGENQIVIKLLRYSEGQKLTIVIRESPFEHTGRIKTDHSWLL